MADAGPSVLVLHRMGNPALVPAFLPGHVRSFESSWPDGACLFHDVSLPLPGWVRRLPFDAVFLDVTLLKTRWMGERLHGRIRENYGFVRDMPSLRVAFPQDEYDCSAILDDWMCDWKVDVVVSVIDGHREVLYPRFSGKGRIETGFTAYVAESLVDRRWTPWERRPIDIGYRAKRLPPYFGRLGEQKWTIGRDLSARAAGLGLRLDIEVGDGHALPGEAWLDFVGSCRAMPATPSGSSLLDPHGEIQRRVRGYLARHPRADFAEVERACFPGRDGVHLFSALSPRILEAALAGTVQLLVPGEYGGILSPGEHFLALAPDASNIRDIIEALGDRTAMESMAARCREAVLAEPRLRRASRDAWIRSLVDEHRLRAGGAPATEAVREGVRRYEAETASARRRLWARQARDARLRRVLDLAPPHVSAPVRRLPSRIRGRA